MFWDFQAKTSREPTASTFLGTLTWDATAWIPAIMIGRNPAIMTELQLRGELRWESWVPRKQPASIANHVNKLFWMFQAWSASYEIVCVCVCVCVCVRVCAHMHVPSCVWLFVTPWTVTCQAPLSMEFSKQKYWSGLPFPTPEDLPSSGINPTSLASSALADRLFFFTTASPGKY